MGTAATGEGIEWRARERERVLPSPVSSLFQGWSSISPFLSLVCLAVIACRQSPAPSVAPSTLIGVYEFERSGRTMGRDWKVESTLSIEDSVNYEMELVITTEDDTDEELEIGTYRVSGTTLVLRSERGDDRHLAIQGDSLVGRKWTAPFGSDAPVYVRKRD
jgi:hypothetical protein